MKKIFFILLVLPNFFLQNYVIAFDNCAITQRYYYGGRFGDCVLTYIKAKWLAHTYGIPFYFKPFAQANVLNANRHEQKVSSLKRKKYKRIVTLADTMEIVPTETPTLFLVDIRTQVGGNLYEKQLLDEQFGKDIKRMLQPVVPINYMKLPKDKITVAVHVRKGSGGDKPLGSIQMYQDHEHLVGYADKIISKHKYSDERWPTKFPPDQFYIDQIKKLSQLLDHKYIHVFIFTDSKKPGQIVKKYQMSVGLPNVEFKSYEKHNYSASLLDDFYNMAEFDCLIRPTSGFSHCAQLIGNHKIIIYPTKARWFGKKLIMDHITIVQCKEREIKKYCDKQVFRLDV